MAKQFDQIHHGPTHDEIARRAYALFEQSGCIPGHDMEHWLQAEAQLLADRKTRPEPRGQSNATNRMEKSASNGTAKTASRQTTLSTRA
jgi:hypothetical protein